MRFPLRQTISIARYIARQKRAKSKHFPLALMLEPLHACNLSCSGCGRIREYSDTLSKMLPLETCLAASDECGAPVVSICGGEPLLYPKIDLLVKGLLNKKRVVYLCTNGQILEKKLSLFRPHPYLNINIHIDGLRDTHDAIVEKKGAFDKAINAAAMAKKQGFTVCTNTTLYKQTSAEEIRGLINKLNDIGVDGILLSPSYNYEDVSNQSIFLTKDETAGIFQSIKEVCKNKKIWSTPLYLDFLKGKREIDCTPWGNVTYNIKGWKAPCYLITDNHYDHYKDFITSVNWEKYGPSQDKRCKHCMVHSGFEATVALKTSESLRDALRMARWTFL